MKQYEPFEGVIGRTLEDSVPWWDSGFAVVATTPR